LPRSRSNRGASVSGPTDSRTSLTKRIAETFAKKLLGDSEVEAILQRLDRLTQEEARMTVANTLEVVHELFNNLKEVMNGEPQVFF
jgi:hypothetical protein